MIKIIGIAILSISIILCAFSIYKRYILRPQNLQMFLEIISKYYFELTTSQKTIKEVVNSIELNNEYISECKRLSAITNINNAFIVENKIYADLFLGNDDKIIIENFYSSCGKGTLKTELTLCQKTIKAIENQLVDAKKQKETFAPLCIKLGIVVAICIVIILI